MRVLLQSRTTLFSVPGGDTTQVVRTAEALRAVGCEVDVSVEIEPDVRRYDLVHLFNFTRPQDVYAQALHAKRYGKKIALSTIYVSYEAYDEQARSGIAGHVFRRIPSRQREYLKVIARAMLNGERNRGVRKVLFTGFRAAQERLLTHVDVLLPNSRSEQDRLISHFPQAGSIPTVIVPNAVDVDAFAKDADSTEVPEHLNDCVLCVARIDGLKNQLNLLRAMQDLPMPVVLIGQPAPNHRKYFEQVKRECTARTHIVGPVEHHKLSAYYRAAKVHALVSWMETTGLSSLEAGLCGCNLVITPMGDTREYFQDDAFYCHPGSVDSIRDAIVRAHAAPRNPKLKQRITGNFTWSKAADRTLRAYQDVLGQRPN